MSIFTASSPRDNARQKTLIAPYGTNLTLTNSKYIDALASLDVDFIAYQDEIGVKKTA